MTEIRTPHGVKHDLEYAINDLMQTYERENGLIILSVSFRREVLISTRRPDRKPVITLVVQVPE
jgi:hypothetical protein